MNKFILCNNKWDFKIKEDINLKNKMIMKKKNDF